MIRFTLTFLIGALLGALAWSFLDARPRHQPLYSDSDLEGVPVPDWIVNARGQRLGSVSVLIPPDGTGHSAIVYLHQSKHTILISDSHAKGSVDTIMLFDPLLNSIVIGIAESGEFANLTVNRTRDGELVSYRDHGLDGEYETRAGPGDSVFAFINGAWSELSIIDGRRFARIGGDLVLVEPVEGKWQKWPQ